MSAKPEKTEGERLAVIETQLARMVSDIESEKETRARANADISAKLDRVESRIAMGIGGLFVLNLVVGLAVAIWKR